MARRRRDEKEPDLGFEVPDFDESDFIRKETISFRTTLILFLYSIITAVVSFFVWIWTGHSWWAALFVGMALGFALRWLYPALKVDVGHFKRKEWVGTGFLYFFSWLAFIIFLTNPPLYDGVEPTLEIHVTPDVQEPGGPVHVTLVAFDNVGIDRDSLDVTITGPDGPLADTAAFNPLNHTGTWDWRLDNATAGTYTVTASLRDTPSGFIQRDPHTTRVTATFEVGPDVLPVRLTGGGTFTSPDDSVRIEVPARVDVHRVFLQLDNGTRIETRCDPDASTVPCQRGGPADPNGTLVYRAQADFAGFGPGNNTFRVHVLEHDAYLLNARYGIGTIDAPLITSPHTITITDADILGPTRADEPRERSAFPAQTPGPGIVLVLLALIGAALIVARRRQA